MTVLKKLKKALHYRRFGGGLLCALFISVLAVAQFGALHKLLHAEAGHSEHRCVFTSVSQGHLDAPGPIVEIVSAPSFIVIHLQSSVVLYAEADSFLPPDRGPPVIPAYPS